jgi:hypothetical protein
MNQHLFLETWAMPGHAVKLRLCLLAGVALFDYTLLEMLRAAVAGPDPPVTEQHSWGVKLLGTHATLIEKRQQKRSSRGLIPTPTHEELIGSACYCARKA